MYFENVIDGDAKEQKHYDNIEFIAYLGTNKCPFCFYEKPIIRTQERPNGDVSYQYCRNCYGCWEVKAGDESTGFIIEKITFTNHEAAQ